MYKQKSLKYFISVICVLALIFGLCVGLISCASDEPNTAQNAPPPESPAEQGAEPEPQEPATPEPEAPTEPTTERPTEAPTEPPRPEKPIEENNVLRVRTGSNQWEGVRITGANMNLEMDKEYSFTFLIYTPDVEVGIVLQANTDNGWNWNVVTSEGAFFFEPTGWHKMSGTLRLDNPDVTGPPTLSLTKLGGMNDDMRVIFYIDDFIVTDLDSGEVVFTEDFEGEATVFATNGSSRAIVPETEIYEEAE